MGIRTLVVFARAPVRGQVKTRLARSVGDDAALALHLAFVSDVCGLGRGVADRRVLAVAGALDGFPPAPDLTIVAQEGAELGARMANAIARYVGDGPVCIVGSDSPSLPREYLVEAFERLKEADVVLGPSTDGGYWLIGARRPAPELFGGIEWGTPSVLTATLERLKDARAALLPFFYDVDEAADLALLRAHLALLPATVAPATRQALAHLGIS